MHVLFGTVSGPGPVRFGNAALTAALRALEDGDDKWPIGTVAMIIAKQPESVQDRLLAVTSNLADFPLLKKELDEARARYEPLPGNFGRQLLSQTAQGDEIEAKVARQLLRL